MEGQSPQKVSVCREFYARFALGKERDPEKLVEFMQNHPSSRNKLNEWLNSSRRNRGYSKGSKHGESFTDSETDSSTVGSQEKYDKCNETSAKEREIGNAYFKKKNLKKSLHHYNEAVRFARFPKNPNHLTDNETTSSDNADDECLAISLANRSAVYAELGDAYFDNSLVDADLALKYGYPERLKTKLFLRKANIFIKKRNAECARACLKQVYLSAPPCNLAEDMQKSQSAMGCCDLHKKVSDLEMQIEKLKTKVTQGHKDNECSDFIENEDFEDACDSLRIRSSEALGRHVVAADNIEEGKLLFREIPFASVLLPEFYASHCHHCHKQLPSYDEERYFFPCRRCNQVQFCDDKCSEAAEIYHKVECGWLDLLHSVGIAHLALRIILVAGADNILDSVQNCDLRSIYSNLEIFHKGLNKYRRVYSLVDHIPEMYEEDLFQYTLTAGLLNGLLMKESSFYDGIEEFDRLKIGGALLRHICQLICNAHAITDILPDSAKDVFMGSDGVVDEYQKRIATAIYPAASMMNHSCDPNISFHFEKGKTLIVKAARPVERKQNVYNCYGPHFRRMPRSERQEVLLQQYFFKCSCDKCTLEKQSGISFADQFNSFKCQSCQAPIHGKPNVPCPTCGKDENVKGNERMYNVICDLLSKGEYLMERNEIDEAIEVLLSSYEAGMKVLFKHNSKLGQICDLLARCYILKGSLRNAEKYLHHSLEYVEARFGKTSQEYFRELAKLETLKI